MSAVHVVDWPLNLKVVNSFEDVQHKMCCKDFKYVYNTHTHTHTHIYIYIYIRISKIGKIMKL